MIEMVATSSALIKVEAPDTLATAGSRFACGAYPRTLPSYGTIGQSWQCVDERLLGLIRWLRKWPSRCMLARALGLGSVRWD